MKDRRRFLRVPEEDKIKYSVIPESKSGRKLTRDLSLGGMRFIADQFVPVGSIIKIELKLKRIERAINLLAKVMWVKSVFADERFEIGVRFIDIKGDDLKFLSSCFSE